MKRKILSVMLSLFVLFSFTTNMMAAEQSANVLEFISILDMDVDFETRIIYRFDLGADYANLVIIPDNSAFIENYEQRQARWFCCGAPNVIVKQLQTSNTCIFK